MVRNTFLPLLALAAASGMGCSNSSGGADAAALAPNTCGGTDDCILLGLDADTCVYNADGGCATYGHCVLFTPEPDTSKCTPQATVCPCSGDTQMIPACWQGLSPIPILSSGACPVDAGTGG
jgi:hypothetical protein